MSLHLCVNQSIQGGGLINGTQVPVPDRCGQACSCLPRSIRDVVGLIVKVWAVHSALQEHVTQCMLLVDGIRTLGPAHYVEMVT